MATHHTPGPWELAIDPYMNICVISADSWICGQLSNPDSKPLAEGEAEANATLIAAAPEMLAALKALHTPYETLTGEALEAGILMEFGPPKPEKGAALLLARSVIAKAEGR